MTTSFDRRTFLKGTTTGVGLGLFGAMGLYSYSSLRESFLPQVKRKMNDIGVLKSVNVTNISETSWFENAILMGDIKKAGGLLVNQYDYNWPPFGNGKGLGKGSYAEGIAKIKPYLPHDLEKAWEVISANTVSTDNAGGYAALLDIEEMDGTKRKFLLDSGWSYKWMDESFKREGIDKMLENKEIEALIISHEHFDHFWGLPVTLKYDPEITIYIPEGFYEEGKQYIKDSGHKGKVIEVKNGLNKIIPGLATYVFPIPIICRVFGEQSIYCNVKDKGLVSVTGCCHQGIIQFAETAYTELAYEKDNFYGIYGGLHISPFDDWDPKYDDLVISLKNYDFDVIGCNHCTGLVCANKFIQAGYPVVRGTAKHRSKDTAYLGNGDQIKFG
ncbi:MULTISPECIES: MBL fold metallo-hydrolase [Cohaesibacter]|uniref:MBL fold metallo-hydrolase n=1 Tax=Cohaesibacter TaxID=655352 RepID=UPI000DEBC4CF|nr:MULTISPECIES: MBL fold metallo-hydrolase [Cohaesibacter]TLP43902.1 MBL fold metallo-hydrolase [Cohaesibacter sp. CAU 1516]